jgi:HTH-type transcriptional regulator/antitoxin HigA
MPDLKYTVIKNEKQYDEYCKKLETLVKDGLYSQTVMDEYELVQLLIAHWDEEHQLNPVEFVISLKDDHGLNQNELARIAGVGKSYISEILNYKKRMSKRVIRNLANHFKVQQEALNKYYRLEGDDKKLRAMVQ